jgi:tetratricopeptide (TPR) repeat protein
VAKINPVKVKQDADKLEKAGKFDQAISLYRQLVEDNPRDWNTIKKIGDLYSRINKNREACEEYAKVADFYSKDGFLLKSIAIWKQINKLDPSALDPYLNLADLYSKQGLMMEAKSQYQIVVDEYIKRGKMRDAGDVLKKMADIDPADLKIRSKLADLYMRDGSTVKAIEEHVAIADELTKKGHLAEALQVLEKGLKLDPKSQKLRGELARIHVVQKNFEKAARYLEELVRESPSDGQLLFRLGESYVGAKKIEEAEAIFKRLLEIDPNDQDAHVQMGRVYLLQGDPDAAFDEFLPVVDRLLGRKEGDKAAALLQQVTQKNASHLKTLAKLAEVFRMLKKDHAVVQTYGQLTEAYIAQGELEQAAGILEILIGMEPQNQQYKTKLEFVRQKQKSGAAAPAPIPTPSVELEEDLEFDVEKAGPAEPAFAGFAAEDVVEAPAPAPVAPKAAAAPARPVVEISAALTDEDKEFIDEHLAEGKVFRKYGLIDKAADQFEAIIARFPDHVEARQELRDVHREKGQKDQAAEQCLALAEIHRLKGDADAAAAFEDEARALAPHLVPATPAPVSAPEPEPAAAPVVEAEEGVLPAVEADEEIPVAVDLEESGIEAEAELPSLDLGVEDSGEELPSRFVEEAPEPEAVAAPPTAEAEPPAISLESAMEEELSLGAPEEELALPEPEPKAPPPPAAAQLKAAPAKAAPAKAAPPPSGLPTDLQKVLDEVESYVSLGFVDDAKDALGDVMAKYPGHPAIQEKIAALGLQLEEAPAEQAPAEEPVAAAPLEVEAEAAPEQDVAVATPEEEEPALALGLEEAEPQAPELEEPVSPPAEEPLGELASLAEPPQPEPLAPEPMPAEAGGGIDLGAELSDLFGAQDAVGEPAPEAAATDLGDAGLEEIFREFKKGVDKQLGKEDYDTRYNLGIAYKEMGLVDEAIAEFQLAAKDEGRLLECASMLGICFMDKGMPKLAVKWFEKGLQAPGRKDEEYMALRYDLAMAHDAAGDQQEALSLFSDLYGQDSSFRDVANKVRELKGALG